MKQNNREFYWPGPGSLVIMLALGFSMLFVSAGETLAADETGITNWQDGVSVGAALPWTTEEMRAAKPYPISNLDAAYQADTADAAVGPTGPPVFVPGARPGAGIMSAATATTSDPQELDSLGVTPLGYSYPGPFTRFHVGAIASYRTYPFRTIGKVFFKQFGTSYVCSAAVIANKGIVTAGHCVHAGNNSSTGWSTNFVFVPAYYNGYAPYGQWPIWSLRTFTDWYKYGGSGDYDHDWGAGRTSYLRLGKTIGQTVGYLGYAYNYSRNQMWWQIGYPQTSPFNGRYMYTCNASYAYTSPFYSGGPAPSTVGCDMTGGCSGGPWVMRFGTGNYVNGVNSHRATARPKELSSPYADTNTYKAIFAWARLP